MGAPRLPAAPSYPGAPSAGGFEPPRPAAPVPPPNPPDTKAADAGKEMERKVLDLEKRLQEEREKVLLANLKSQEEATYAAKVETAIKDVQDKLRRDRRDAESEETRLKLEGKIQELEARMAQERETWVNTLKGQVRTRETQDKEIETHFTLRLQEMERRWLEEKAHWQKVILSKDEEIRNLRALAEKLKGVEIDYQKGVQQAKFLEERLTAATNDAATAHARVKGLEDKEREYFQVKAELMTAREQARLVQERLEHDVSAARSSAKDREERLAADNQRLQREIDVVGERIRHDMELEVQKHKAEANLAHAALQKLRAVAGALERQTAALKVQAEQGVRAKSEFDKLAESSRLELERTRAAAAMELERVREESRKEFERWREEAKAEKAMLQRRIGERADEVRREMEEENKLQLDQKSKEWQRTFLMEQERLRLANEQAIRTQVQKAEEDAQARARQAIEDARGEASRLKQELETKLLRSSEEAHNRLEQLRVESQQELAKTRALAETRLTEAVADRERKVRDELDRNAAAQRQQLEQGLRLEIENLTLRLKARDQDLADSAAAIEKLRSTWAKEEGARAEWVQERGRIEAAVQELKDQVSGGKTTLASVQAKLAEEEARRRSASEERDDHLRQLNLIKGRVDKLEEERRTLAQAKADLTAALDKTKEEHRSVDELWRREEHLRRDLDAKVASMEAELKVAKAEAESARAEAARARVGADAPVPVRRPEPPAPPRLPEAS